jgi:hypothetical protein
MAEYLIDNIAVNQRLDWRHQLAPGALSARLVESFPGDSSRYVIKGVVRPGDLIVSGFLEASGFAALHTLIRQYEAMLGDVTTHTVTVHGVDFAYLDLAEFQVEPRIQAYRSAGVSGVRVACRFHWQQTRH